MKTSNEKIIKYFGFGTNRDLEMMIHMIGREEISGEPGKLFGYELCIQKGEQFRDVIPKSSPLTISPRAFILKTMGPGFKMYVSRPNPNGIIYGTIWDITPEEFEFVREWEMVEYGVQEDTKGIALNLQGEFIGIITQSFLNPPIPEIDQVIIDPNYEPYIASKETMLKEADLTRIDYLRLKNKKQEV
jgi:hypothetical protein